MQNEQRIEFTKEMRKDYTILVPNMADIHFRIIKNAFVYHGYRLEVLSNNSRSVVDEGLKYVHNDTCYPALLCIGQMIDALKSGKYNLNRVALMITQTGGGCRASNYIHLLRKALIKAGYENIPVISLNLSGLEKNSGFKLTLRMLRKALCGLCYGDILMILKNQVKPYEKNKGETDALVESYINKLTGIFNRGGGYTLPSVKKIFNEIASDFAKIQTILKKKVKVGVVGEIYVKYSPLGNNELESFLLAQDCEVTLPGIIGFMLFKVDNRLEDIKLYGGNEAKRIVVKALFDYIISIETAMLDAIAATGVFSVPMSYKEIKKLVEGIIGYGCKMGEGWLLTAEMAELIHHGFENIVCAQPFGCLPNHIVGKGMIRKLKEVFPNANIVPIDYDPGATKVNQENRIKLMLSVARENLFSEEKERTETKTKVHSI